MKGVLMKIFIVSGLIWIGILGEGQAGTHDAGELSGIIQKALLANSELMTLESELEMNRAQIGPAGSLEDPMLAVEMMNVPTDSLRLNEVEMSGIQISLAQKLPYPGKRSAKRDIVTLRSRTLEHRIQQVKLDIAWNIKRIYYELY